jgi:DNA topoisomerase-1
MKINGDKGYFSDKGTGKAKKTKAQKDKFISNFWDDFTKGTYYKRKIKQPCVSCDGKQINKYCWAKDINDFNRIKKGDYTEHRYMRQTLSNVFKLYSKTDFDEFIRQIDFIADRKSDEREFRKGDSDDKIELRKQEIVTREEKKHNRTYALVDGRKEPLGKVTPMLLRLFTGAKSSLYQPGQITSMVQPEDCILNICGGNIPRPPPGRCWGAVVCDPTVKIVVWFKPIFLRKGDIKVMSDGDIKFGDLSLISSKDKLFKFEKARKLNKNIDTVRAKYKELLSSDSKEKQQIGVVIYLLDIYGFRGGSEEDKDSDKEEDGIGVTTLPISSIKQITNNSIHLNFKGKSGIEFDEKIKIPANISELIKSFIEGRPKNTRVFNLIDLDKINEYLHSIDSLFSAKVFRTRLASSIMYTCLNSKKVKQGDDKKESKEKFDSCNLSVALALNHKKKATIKQDEKINAMKEEIETLERQKPKDSRLIKEKEEVYKRQKQLWEVNLSTSIKNYIDPRIIVAWVKNQSSEWDEGYDGKTKTINNIDDLYLLPQMKFVKAKTEEDNDEGGGAVKNPEFVWAIESIDDTWKWTTSQLLISDTLQPKVIDTDKSNAASIQGTKVSAIKRKPPAKTDVTIEPKVSVIKRKPPRTKISFSKQDDSSSDSDDDVPLYQIANRKDLMLKYGLTNKAAKYVQNMPGTKADFELLLQFCEDPEKYIVNLSEIFDLVQWFYPLCKYAIDNFEDPQSANYYLVEFYDSLT